MSQEQPKASFITFYSFKGGVGRSMALINTAGILAGRGFRVLVIDLDLEAPGLSYLDPDAPAASARKRKRKKRPGQLGFVDLLSDAKQRGEEADLFKMSPADLAERYTHTYHLPPELREFQDGSLHIMPAGKMDGSYAQRLDALNLHQLYEEGLGEPLIRAFKKKLAEADLYHYVLVDSRTGFSDEAGICTRDLADHVMILSGLNRQNVEGTCEFLKAFRAATEGKTPKFQIILSPVPNGEDTLLDEREAMAKAMFDKAWGSEVDPFLYIPYHPQLALTEEPHIFRRRRGYLFEAYRDIEQRMLHALGHDAQTLMRRIEDTLQEKDYPAVLRVLRHILKVGGRWKLSKLAGNWAMDDRRLPRGKAEEDLGQEKFTLESILDDEDGRRVVEFVVDHVAVDETAWESRRLLDRLKRSSPDLADRLYKRVVEASPRDADTLRSYATFLKDQRGDMDGAEAYYKRAIEADPKSASLPRAYATFLEQERGDMDGAETYYKRAIDADPKDASFLSAYASFLVRRRRDRDDAETYYKRAIDAAPKDASFLSAYASFLVRRRRDRDDAETYYKRAIDAAPKSAFILSAYATFLEQERGDMDGAETYYKRAIDAAPKSAFTLSRYARFLARQRRDMDGAETCYKRAIDAAPKSASILSAYATFLEQQRGDMDSAETYNKRAIAADSEDAGVLANYGQFLVGLARLSEGEKELLSGFERLEPFDSANMAEVCFSLWLVSQMQKHDAKRWEQRFKFLIQRGFERHAWSFDRMLKQAEKSLPPEEFEYAKSLALAFLDESKVADLEQYERWRTLEAVNPMGSGNQV